MLGDSANGRIEMLKWVKKQPRTSGIFGRRSDRRLDDGRQVSQGLQRGQQVVLQGLNFPVTLSWYWLDRDDGSLEKRFVISTKPLSAIYITRLGRRLWQIDFFLNCEASLWLSSILVKHFIGVEPWFVLSFIAYLVASLAYLGLGKTSLPDWAGVALLARETFWHLRWF